MKNTRANNGLWGLSVRALFGGGPEAPAATASRPAKVPMTKSEIQHLFARELGYVRDFSSKMQQPALR